MRPDTTEEASVYKVIETNYEIGGAKIPMVIECDAHVTVETWFPKTSGAMEDAVEGDTLITVDSVDMDVCLYTCEESFITFTTNSMSFFNKFCDIDSGDLL